jgi:hypothetical protein
MMVKRLSTMLCGLALLLFAQPATATDIDGNSFGCLTKMTAVRQFYVGNLQGNLAATLATANSPKGNVYPAGSLVQLIPGEAMVKRESGFDATTSDWEFFQLEPSKDGTRIKQRGTTQVSNRLGTCFGCHKAAPRWDFVCETDHGCAPLPITGAMIRALQRTDPRCGGGPISPEDAEALKQLKEVQKPSK